MARKTVRVAEIVIELADGNKLKLSLDAARELHDALEDVLGKEKVIERGYSYPVYPYTRPYWSPTYVTWGSGTNDTLDGATYTIRSTSSDAQLLRS